MSVFDNEWRDCLREQYKHTIRQNNQKNIASLRVVMNQVGFREDELRQLEMIATMHIDDVADDFVPNLDILDTPTPPFKPTPLGQTSRLCHIRSNVNAPRVYRW